jgi:3-oxoadipate enol-lactonase / 4-carboxymuconolactone decarboxylase
MPRITVNGVELFYDLAGPESAPVIAFSNSLGTGLEMWDAVVPAFAGRYRCLRYDTRGHGRSGSADVAVTVDDLAADFASLLEALHVEKAHIVGLSLGGMTAQALALIAPEKVRTLVLIATSAYLPTPEFWKNRADTIRKDGPGSVADMLMPRWFTAPFRERAPEAVERTRQGLMAIDRAGYARCCEAIGAMDLRERIGKITAPTLVLVGADDPVTTPAMAEDIRARIPGAELTILANAAHLVSVERPDAVAAHLDAFLDAQAGITGASDAFHRGLAHRKAVLGTEHVDRSLATAGAFGMPWQDFITRFAWNEIWGDITLLPKTRSLLTLAMMIALHREEEFKLHLRPALRNGVTIAELAALIRQAAVYTGIPAGNAAMRWAREVLGDELK